MLLTWVLAALLGAQSLGEVAAREKKRREQNARAGVEVVTYRSVGGRISTEEPSDDTPNEPLEETVGSPLDDEWARGESLEPRLAEIARAADEVDALYERYVDECRNRYLIGVTPPGFGVPVQSASPFQVHLGRNWFVVLENPAGPTPPIVRGAENILLVPLPQCEGMWNEIVNRANQVKRSMRALLEDARRERILPGVMRDLRLKYRLEWSGWER